MALKFECPRCGSTFVQSLAVLHAYGTRVTEVKRRSLGVGLTTGNLGFGTNKKTYVNTSGIGQRAAPPEQKRRTWNYIVSIMIGVIFGWLETPDYPWLSLFLFATAAYSLIMLIRNSRYNRALPQLQASWDKSFLCKTCGHTFEHDLDSNGMT